MSFTVIPVSENLPRFAARRVSDRGGKDFSGEIVVFPTARLGQHFRRELAELAGACLPPRVLTLSSLMERLAPGGGGRPLSPLERILILRSLLGKGEYRHLGPGMEGIISSFWEELVQAGHPPDRAGTFELMETAFRENPLGSESYAAYWIEFGGELARLSASYRERMREMGLREPSWERGEVQVPEGKILVCGFYDATPIQVDFLKKLGDAAEFIYQAEKSPAFTAVVSFAKKLGHDIHKKLPEPVPPLLQAADAFLISALPPEEAERISMKTTCSRVEANRTDATAPSSSLAARTLPAAVFYRHWPSRWERSHWERKVKLL